MSNVDIKIIFIDFELQKNIQKWYIALYLKIKLIFGI